VPNLKILVYGDSLLREHSREVKQLTKGDADLIRSMGETMYAAQGIGLAAPQVGILRRIVVLDIDQIKKASGEKHERKLQVFINPEIKTENEEDSPFTEGCLSVPGVDGEIYRPTLIRLAYRDEKFDPHEMEADGLLARVLQHEIDHLNGVLFIDHLAQPKRIMLAGQLRRIRKKSLSKEDKELGGPRL
jgi:peptide deformylase